MFGWRYPTFVHKISLAHIYVYLNNCDRTHKYLFPLRTHPVVLYHYVCIQRNHLNWSIDLNRELYMPIAMFIQATPLSEYQISIYLTFINMTQISFKVQWWNFLIYHSLLLCYALIWPFVHPFHGRHQSSIANSMFHQSHG